MSSHSETQLEYKEWITGVFDRAAPTYDRVGPRIWSCFGNRLIDLGGLCPGAYVLDVGCGRGAILFPAGEKVGPTGRVVGIDQSEGMVNETAAEIERLGLSNAEIHLIDAEDGLPFADDHLTLSFARTCCTTWTILIRLYPSVFASSNQRGGSWHPRGGANSISDGMAFAV